jgi:hypothetical protein
MVLLSSLLVSSVKIANSESCNWDAAAAQTVHDTGAAHSSDAENGSQLPLVTPVSLCNRLAGLGNLLSQETLLSRALSEKGAQKKQGRLSLGKRLVYIESKKAQTLLAVLSY